MPPKTRLPTKEEIQFVADMKAKKQSDTKIAEALGMSRSTFIKWKKLAIKNPNSDGEQDVTVGEQITHSIEEGKKNRMARHLDLAVDAVDELLKTHVIRDIKTKKVKKKDKNGKMRWEEEWQVITEKTILPNPAMVQFTLVNKAPEEWHPLNQRDESIDPNINMPDGAEIIVEDAGEMEEE